MGKSYRITAAVNGFIYVICGHLRYSIEIEHFKHHDYFKRTRLLFVSIHFRINLINLFLFIFNNLFLQAAHQRKCPKSQLARKLYTRPRSVSGTGKTGFQLRNGILNASWKIRTIICEFRHRAQLTAMVVAAFVKSIQKHQQPRQNTGKLLPVKSANPTPCWLYHLKQLWVKQSSDQ